MADTVKVDGSIVLTLVHTGKGTSVSRTVKVPNISELGDVTSTGVNNKVILPNTGKNTTRKITVAEARPQIK